MINVYCGILFIKVLIILLHRSIQTVKCSLKKVSLCKFMAWCSDVLVDKLHPQFDMKFLRKKGTAYTLVFVVIFSKSSFYNKEKYCEIIVNSSKSNLIKSVLLNQPYLVISILPWLTFL